MAAVLRGGSIEIKDTTIKVTVANNPTAKMMYYLNCIASILNLDEIEGIQRYKNYSNYYNMTIEDKNAILRLCHLFSPQLLINQCIFLSEDIGGSSSNRFFHINSSEVTVAATDNIVIGGIRRRVTKIMLFKMSWLNIYYKEPIKKLFDELRSPQPRNSGTNNSSSCKIL